MQCTEKQVVVSTNEPQYTHRAGTASSTPSVCYKNTTCKIMLSQAKLNS